jgi:sugar lactone lactonase YvrE
VQAGYLIGQSPQFNSAETTATAMAFSQDGYHYYVAGTTNDVIYQYDMGGQWEVTTPTPTSTKTSPTLNETAISSLFMANDGKKFWTAGSNTIKEYYMPASLYIGGQAPNGYGMTFSGGGDYVYVIDISSDTIKRYDMAPGYDIAAGAYVQASPVVSAQDGNFYAIDIQKNDVGSVFGWGSGSTVYLLGSTGIIYQYVLPGPWDLQSGMTNNANINITSFENNPRGLRFSWDGYDIFIVGLTTSGNTPTVWRIPFSYARGAGFDQLLYWFTAYSIENRTSRGLQQGGESNNLTAPTGITFSLDGTSMQVSDSSGVIYQYQLTLPWDITTATFKLAHNLSWVSTSIQDIYMSYYGDKFFTLDLTNDRINAFSLGPV